MKILHVAPSYMPAYDFGGPINAVHELCAALVRKGHDISVFTTNVTLEKKSNITLNAPQDIDGVKVTYYPVDFPRTYCHSIRLAKALKEHIAEFDILHIHSVYRYTTFAAARLCERYNKPYILNPFGALDPSMIRFKGRFKKELYVRLIEKRTVNNAKVVDVASAYEKERFEEMNFKTPAMIIPRGINPADYGACAKRQDLRIRYPELSGKKALLFLGRIHPKKGLDLLAGAFKKVAKERNDVFLVIAGSGEEGYVRQMKSLFRKSGLSGSALFTGMLLGPDKLGAFYGSDIFVLPSYGENFGIAVLEAMACGLAVVVTEKTGLFPDILEYKAGVVTSCDEDEIAGSILKQLDDEKTRKSMGENGKRLASDRFTNDRAADMAVNAYRNILNI